MEKLSNNIKDYQFVNYYPNDNSITFNNYPFQNLSKYKFSKIDFYRNTIDINETVWCICFPKTTNVSIDILQTLNENNPKIPNMAYWVSKTNTCNSVKTSDNQMIWKDDNTQKMIEELIKNKF